MVRHGKTAPLLLHLIVQLQVRRLGRWEEVQAGHGRLLGQRRLVQEPVAGVADHDAAEERSRGGRVLEVDERRAGGVGGDLPQRGAGLAHKDGGQPQA